MNLEDYINQAEGRRIEFKERVPGRKSLARTIIAFANDAGGELLIGIRDKPREVTGIKEEELLKTEEQITGIIHSNCVPSILPEISSTRSRSMYRSLCRQNRLTSLSSDTYLKDRNMRVFIVRTDGNIRLQQSGTLQTMLMVTRAVAGQKD